MMSLTAGAGWGLSPTTVNSRILFTMPMPGVRALLAEKQLEAANTQFESALHDLEGADYVLARIEVLVWQAICLKALGRIGEAEKVLKRAMKAAQTDG